MRHVLLFACGLFVVQGSILNRKIREAVNAAKKEIQEELKVQLAALREEIIEEIVGNDSPQSWAQTTIAPGLSNDNLAKFKQEIINVCSRTVLAKVVGDNSSENSTSTADSDSFVTTIQPPMPSVVKKTEGSGVEEIQTSNNIDMFALEKKIYGHNEQPPKGRKLRLSLKYEVECTSEGIKSREFRKHTKIMTKNFKKTYNDNQNSITNSISDAKQKSDKMAERTLSIKDTEDVSDESYAASVSMSGGFPLFSMSGSASFAMNQFSSNKKMTHDEKEKMVDTAKASSMSKLMSTQVGKINSLVNSMEGHNETMVYEKTEFQEGRYQLWRRVKKWFVIDGDNLYEEKFEYIHDSPDEITRQEKKQCASDYLNDVVLSGTGFKTNEQTLDFDTVITVPDFQKNAKRSMIVMWAGSVKNIPQGWLLCDGKFGTPDLRHKFIIGSQIRGLRTEYEGGHKHKISYTGKNRPIDIKPQYYSLAFIMKD